MKRFPSRCACCSRCWLSSRTDMTDNKRDAGDNNSPGSDDFCQNSRIFGHRCPPTVERLTGRLRFRPMKPFLNVLREFGEIDLRNSRFSFKLNPIRFDAAHRRVFVYLPGDSFEVLSKRYRRRQRGRDCQHCVPKLQFAWQETRSLPPKNYPQRNCQYCELVGCACECRNHFTCLSSFQRRTSASSSKTPSAFQPCATVKRLMSPQTGESPVPLQNSVSISSARGRSAVLS